MVKAARRVFNAEVVRPMGLTVNVMGPMAARGTHVDSPTFRGISRDTCPTWLIQVMGASRLFERWAVRIAGAVSWVYRQPGGGYKYWPDGYTKAPVVENGPFGNVAVMGDNDYMYHQVQAIGHPDRYAEGDKCGPKSQACFRDGSWQVLENGEVRVRYDASEVRASLLWRAYAFRDETEAAVFDEHADDLTIGDIVDRFRRDLAERGTPSPEPADPFDDKQWQSLLRETYGFALAE
jgi:hypothetical protein